MKKRFSDEKIISILRWAEGGFSAREVCHKHAISDATHSPGYQSLKSQSVNWRSWPRTKLTFCLISVLIHKILGY